LNRVANTYSANNHLGAQRVAARTLPAIARVPVISRELFDAIAFAGRRAGVVPAWVVFGMILLAAMAVCATVTMRTRAELQNSFDQHHRMSTEIEDLQKANAALRTEVGRLQTDATTIESAARSRLNMVRPNEIVVPIETRNQISKVESQSFVR
jgi:cell division protein FtsL